jgi:hypothetical protein
MSVAPFAKPGSAARPVEASRVDILKAELQRAVADETAEFVACMVALVALAERTDRTPEAHPGARSLANEVINWLPTRLDAVKAVIGRAS